MRFIDIINEKQKEKVKIEVTPKNAIEDASKIYKGEDELIEFLSRIHKPHTVKDRNKCFTYRIVNQDNDKIEEGETSINFNADRGKQASEEFSKIIKYIKGPKPTEWESILKSACKKINDADDQNFIENYFIPKVANPAVTPSETKNTNIENLEDRYKIFGKAMVFRAGKCVSKLTDVNTKIDSDNFQDIMQKCFGAATDSQGESDTFLNQFSRLKEKLQIDAAKCTINSISKNGDIESIPESYYDAFTSLLPMLMEADENDDDKKVMDFIELPKKVSDFVNNDMKKALIQASNVAKKYPRQYKIWYSKLEAAFNEGVEEEQEKERKSDLQELEDPITGKVVKRHGKAWGTGGPNGFIRDNPQLDSLVKDIKEQKWTMFNCVAKTVLNIFDALETGGKIYQKLCDDMSEGYKQIMHSLGSTKPEDYSKEAEKYSKAGQENTAFSIDMLAVIAQLTEVYRLLGEGKIGKINGKYKTVTTINENNTTVIQNALNKLANLIATYTKKEEEYKKWKEEKDKENETKIKQFEEQISKLEAERSGGNSEQQQAESVIQDMGRPYLVEQKKISLKQLIREADENEEQKKDKSDIEKEIDSRKKELESLKDNKNKQVQVNLENYSMMLDEYTNAVGYIGKISDIHSFLVKMFDENEAKEQYAKMFNGNDNEEGEGNENEEDNESSTETQQVTDSFRLKIKNPFITEAVEEFDDDDDGGNDDNNGDKEDNKDTTADNGDKPKEEKQETGKEGNLDWISTGSGKNLVELYRQFGVNTQNTLLDISALKHMAKDKNQDNTIKHFSEIVKSLNNVVNSAEITPITDGLIAFDYAFGEDADENKLQTLVGAFELVEFKQDKNEDKEKEKKEEKREPGQFTKEELQKKTKELLALIDNGSKVMQTVNKLNDMIKEAVDDNWYKKYPVLLENNKKELEEIWNKCIELYPAEGKKTKAGYDWIMEKKKIYENQVFLNQIWLTIAVANFIGSKTWKAAEEMKESIDFDFTDKNLFEGGWKPSASTEEIKDDYNNEYFDLKAQEEAATPENIANAKATIEQVDFNILLPKDYKAYNINEGAAYNENEKKIAESLLGTRDKNTTKKPKALLKHIIHDVPPEATDGTKVYDYLKSANCGESAVFVMLGHVSKNIKSDDRDIYLMAGAMHAVCVVLEKYKGVKAESVSLAGYSDNALINEIYKYIRG